jgi:hypothetical protein
MKLKSIDNIVTDHYNNAEKEIRKYIQKNGKYKYKFYYLDNIHYVDVFENNTQILKAEYEVLGLYNIVISTWLWSWANSYIEKPLAKSSLAINVFYNELDSDQNKYDQEELEKINYYVNNPSFYIKSENIVNLIKLSLYGSDAKWILGIKDDENNPSRIEYIIVKKIIQIF